MLKQNLLRSTIIATTLGFGFTFGGVESVSAGVISVNTSQVVNTPGDATINGNMNVGTPGGAGSLTIDTDTLTINQVLVDPPNPTDFDGSRLHIGTQAGGFGGPGTLTIQNGGTLNLTVTDPNRFHPAGLQISNVPSFDGVASEPGNATVDNGSINLSSATQNTFINIGTDGAGTLMLQNGSSLSARSTSGSSTINVGRDGMGALTVESGSTLLLGTDVTETLTNTDFVGLRIGREVSGPNGFAGPGPGGTMTIDDATVKVVTNSNSTVALVDVGSDNANGTLTVQNGGQLSVQNTGDGIFPSVRRPTWNYRDDDCYRWRFKCYR